MHFQRFTDVHSFLDIAEGFLDANDPATNLILANAYWLRDTPPTAEEPAYMSLVREDGDIILVAIMRHRLPLGVYAVHEVSQDALTALGVDLLAWQRDIQTMQAVGGVENGQRAVITQLVAPAYVAHRFAQVWRDEANITAKQGMHMRLYELREVHEPRCNNGHMRIAQEADKPLVAAWIYAMDHEAVSGRMDEADAELAAERFVQNRRTFIWEHNGDSVTMVCKTRPTKRGIVLNGVYTPPLHRMNMV